jgi:endonuclease/exonuclease/phosphatase family metal-dependent hydrolase
MRLPSALHPVACALLACAPPPLPSATRPVPSGNVRIATWNVHDLFDAEDRRAPPGELDEVPAPDEVEGKLRRVAAVLARLDADLVLLQEVENLPLAEGLATRSGYSEARLVDGVDPRGIDVALLSRAPVERYASHAGETGGDGRPLWSRDCVEARVATGLGPLRLVGGHLVSRLTDPDGDRRREQAARTREIADGLLREEPDALLLVGGDLNDVPASAALEPLLGDGEWVDALELFGEEETWTWEGASGGARFDYLLLPRADAWRVVGAEVVDGEDVAEASDHRPVVVDLRE